MLTHTEEVGLSALSKFISDHRKDTIERVLDLRTRYVTIILEEYFPIAKCKRRRHERASVWAYRKFHMVKT
jgi:hypothetical protein